MRALADATRARVSLAVRDADRCVDLYSAPGAHPVQVVRSPGRHLPLHAKAGEYVLLAFEREDPQVTIEALGAEELLPAHTDATVTKRRQLVKVLTRVR